ncbi:DUF99 family protein [Vulcanisaeta souniana]|uniref:UPF0215 protein GCM10007112_04310 n=1 Tax=Vulcanisaeta souniana JCM 11219 TaxID=1293586 RepID=A0A830ECA0_9CREN|nr:DUF99 family protein [Vulcanisaeta souniana]BDR91774.1 hypothetical protein Vsou_08670 [Vulcanisaeta souniana JCM 11219]GGI70506.1 hypothetical protein GCM10007112_04310 [Vulcanisaeta souniana JCM 11219]
MSIDALVSKPGVRALGIAESFRLDLRYSILVGVVMRSDGVIDGVSLGRTTVGGLDATDAVISLYRSFNRNDIQLVMIDGCIISWYNIVDLEKLADTLGLPIMCLTFEEPEGDVINALRKLFPGDSDVRIRLYEKLGKPDEMLLPGGLKIYVRFTGIDYRTARTIIRKFIKEGKRPEPIRVARLIANALLNYTKIP